MRFFLVDRIDELKPYTYAEAVKCISLSEDCFEHHFPGQPVYPGSLLIEAMAQLGGALLEISMREREQPCPRCVMSTVKGKFRDFVHPGDTLRLRAEVLSRHADSARVRAFGKRDGATVCEADIIYTLVRIDDPLLQASRDELLDVLTRRARVIP